MGHSLEYSIAHWISLLNRVVNSNYDSEFERKQLIADCENCRNYFNTVRNEDIVIMKNGKPMTLTIEHQSLNINKNEVCPRIYNGQS